MDGFKTLTDALRRGDVVNNVRGASPAEALASLVKTLQLPVSVDRKNLANALEERETLATTALGLGFAIPHPRRRIFDREERGLVAVAYLEHPVDWGAQDSKPASVLFLVLSGSDEQHLALLSEIATLAESEDFRRFIASNPQKDEILSYLASRPS